MTENTEAQEANLLVGRLRGFDAANSDAQESNLSDSPAKKLNGWDGARFCRGEVGKQDEAILAVAGGDSFNLGLPDWNTHAFNWNAVRLLIDDSCKATLERGCSLKLNGVNYDVHW